MTDPRAEVTRRLDGWRAAAARAGRDDARVALLRLLVFLAALATGWAVLSGPRWPAAALLLPGAAFLALVVRHDRVLAAQARARRAIAFHEGAIARLDGRFAGQGVPGDRFADPDHRYALDLDLFGAGSLFELLCAARTRPGEERLAAWLLAPAGADEVRARQRAVAELSPRLD
ncbi:MAG TPA: DNA mismatch repair protein MutS, partial [Anaeromyxobacteraceae bacterium]|nr:DNA mismatch repair protein MutS [Anaeromyxobacteraceae bacterium]